MTLTMLSLYTQLLALLLVGSLVANYIHSQFGLILVSSVYMYRYAHQHTKLHRSIGPAGKCTVVPSFFPAKSWEAWKRGYYASSFPSPQPLAYQNLKLFSHPMLYIVRVICTDSTSQPESTVHECPSCIVVSRVSVHGRLEFRGQNNRGGHLHRETICTYVHTYIRMYTCKCEP